MTNDDLTEILKDNWDWIYNLSLKMVLNPSEGDDAVQEILEKIIKGWPQFRGESKVTTWIYRIAVNHLISRKSRGPSLDWQDFQEDMHHYEPYQGELGLSSVEEKIYVDEIKIGCTTAILQCLPPRDRMVFILDNILKISANLAAEYCSVGYDNYRKILSRSREKVRNFLKGNCGLLNPQANCQCRRRISHAIKMGRLNPQRLLYQNPDQWVKRSHEELNRMDELAAIYGEQPLLQKAFPLEGEMLFLKD